MLDYEDADAVGLAQAVRAGEVSPLELVDAAIQRIEARDSVYNAVVRRTFEQAREAAQGALPDGPLRGVPYLLKDLHVAVRGEPTGAGTKLRATQPLDYDSRMVERLRAGGLVVLGRTNTPELGLMAITESKLYGPARNPWDPEHTPGGSSGGAGAAVAARYVPAAHASDGGGSIRIPASHCGLVGLKPTRGRTPLGPAVGEGWGGLSIEHAVTRTVRDCAALLDITRGPEPGAPYQVRAPERPYLEEVDRDPGTLRVAVVLESWVAGENDAEVVAAAEATARLVQGLGHQVDVISSPLDADAMRAAYFACVAAALSASVLETAAAAGRPARPADFEVTTWTFHKIGGALSARELEQHRRVMHRAGLTWARELAPYDVVLTPTCARPPAKVGELYPDASKERLMSLFRVPGATPVLLSAVDGIAAQALGATPNTQIANMLGLPAISLPLWWAPSGLPVGLQFIAHFGREDILFRLAAQLEKAQPWAHRRPDLAPVEAP
ncbi:MAG: amidase [Myxococcota bacterium]